MSRSLSLFAGLALLLAAAVPARASDSAASEASHAAGGAVIAGAVTYLADDHWPKYRGWIGFGAGTLVGIVGEAVDSANGNGFSGLDVAATALGAAIGAFVTDQYILMPVVEPDSEQGAYLGVAGRYRF